LGDLFKRWVVAGVGIFVVEMGVGSGVHKNLQGLVLMTLPS
jgi:hypothetical protein